jgi:hypothetical protein
MLLHLTGQPAQKCLMFGSAAFGKKVLAEVPV